VAEEEGEEEEKWQFQSVMLLRSKRKKCYVAIFKLSQTCL